MKHCNEHLALHFHIAGGNVERISTSSVNIFLLKIDKECYHILLPKVNIFRRHFESFINVFGI